MGEVRHYPGKLGRVVDLLDRFGGEIEADLFDHGWDLLDYFRGSRPWTQLLRLIDRLPAHSRYVAALLDDPDTAEQIVLHAPPEPPQMTMAGFGPVESLLTSLLDAVNANTSATIAAAGVDPPKIDPAPRPVTELERARNRLRVKSRESLAALALGGDRMT